MNSLFEKSLEDYCPVKRFILLTKPLTKFGANMHFTKLITLKGL